MSHVAVLAGGSHRRTGDAGLNWFAPSTPPPFTATFLPGMGFNYLAPDGAGSYRFTTDNGINWATPTAPPLF